MFPTGLNRPQMVEYILRQCDLVGIKFVQVSGKKFKLNDSDPDDVLVCGYFSEDEKVLAVARDLPDLEKLRVLIHEYCHATQWIHGIFSDELNIILERWHSYICGKHDYESLSERDSDTRVIRDIERDCEIRTVGIIKSNKLKLSAESYIRQANAYLYFHAEAAARRSWYSVCPWSLRSLLSLMPTTFFGVDYDRPTLEIQRAMSRAFKRRK